MFRRFLKRAVVLASVCVMSLSLVACGDKEKTTTEATTTEAATTEATEAPTEEDTEEAGNDTSEGTVGDDGSYTLSGMTISIPEGYEYSADNSSSSSATFVDNTNGGALVIAVDNHNVMYNDSNVVEEFDKNIKAPYGDQVTHSPVTYNGHAGEEWVLDNEEGGYVGRSLVICDGSMMIYIEFVSYSGSIDAYTEAVSTISY